MVLGLILSSNAYAGLLNFGFSDKSKILIKNLDVNKRPISAVADNFEVRNAKTIKIQANKKISFELLYDKNNSLHKKIKIEQTRKETSNN